MYVVCREHLEQAIDEFVDMYETSPDLYELNSVTFTDWAAPVKCNFCQVAPVYLVV